MFQQDLDPVGGSLALSALCAALPLLTLFVLLGGLRLKAWLAGLISLVVALAVAVVLFSMPLGQALLAGTEGAAFGFFPILWIVINAIWVYNLTVASGHFDVLRRSFEKVSPDQRIQAIIIAFCFGALLEALAGFGTPVAITVVMLMALGFQPVKAAAVSLIANTAPVAFGALATPIVTLATVSSGASDDPRLDVDTLGAMVGRQTPILAVVVPLVLVLVVDGARGVRQTWLPALVCGLTFGLAQFVGANYVSVPLADIIAALVSAASVVLLLRAWKH
jgi:lactate permease